MVLVSLSWTAQPAVAQETQPQAAATQETAAAASKPASQDKKPNILVIWGDDIGQSNISAYTMGLMGYRTPNIDRVAREGMI